MTALAAGLHAWQAVTAAVTYAEKRHKFGTRLMEIQTGHTVLKMADVCMESELHAWVVELPRRYFIETRSRAVGFGWCRLPVGTELTSGHVYLSTSTIFYVFSSKSTTVEGRCWQNQTIFSAARSRLPYGSSAYLTHTSSAERISRWVSAAKVSSCSASLELLAVTHRNPPQIWHCKSAMCQPDLPYGEHRFAAAFVEWLIGPVRNPTALSVDGSRCENTACGLIYVFSLHTNLRNDLTRKMCCEVRDEKQAIRTRLRLLVPVNVDSLLTITRPITIKRQPPLSYRWKISRSLPWVTFYSRQK